MDQFQLCLEQTSPFIHVLHFLFGQIAQRQREREISPHWRDKMKEDGRAVRFLRQAQERTRIMDGNGLFVRPGSLPASHCSFRGLPGCCTSLPRSQGAQLERPGPALTVLGSPWWSWPGPITARSGLISTASSGLERRMTKGSCGLGFRARQVDKMLKKYLKDYCNKSERPGRKS